MVDLSTAILGFLYMASMLTSLLFAWMNWKYLQGRHLLLLGVFLHYVFIQESITSYFYWSDAPYSTTVIYNIYRPLTVLVFAVLYYRMPVMARWRNLISGMTVAYAIAIAWGYTQSNDQFTYAVYLTLARGFVITIFAIMFLLSYFNLPTPKEEIFWRPVLRMTIGLIAFYPVISISLAFQEYLYIENATFYGYTLYRMVPQVMSIIMYGFFSYAFYLCHRKN